MHFRADVSGRQFRRMDASSLTLLTHLSQRVLCVYFGLLSSGLPCKVQFLPFLNISMAEKSLLETHWIYDPC